MNAPIELLGSYIPGLVKERLAADPTPITEPLQEHACAAALMADVSGFTQLTEPFAAHRYTV